jgi:hypothetical protein
MDDELRAELLRRVAKDQAVRKALDIDGMREADGENLPWLKAVIAEHGWPGTSLVGTDGAQAAWLLAQHADADPAFQRQCLDLLTAAVAAGEASERNLAYLTDRVLLAEGQPQVYGTQMTNENGHYVPRNLRDPDSVDERRAAVGLGPIAEYMRRFDSDPTPRTLVPCPQCKAWVGVNPPAGGEPFTMTCAGCGAQTTVQIPAGQGRGGTTGETRPRSG